ncbi:hypothetical protein [Enterococcus olivae]
MSDPDEFTDMELEVSGLGVAALEEENVYTIWIVHQGDDDQMYLGILPKDTVGSDYFIENDLQFLLAGHAAPVGITADAQFVDIFTYDDAEGNEVSVPRLYIENVEVVEMMDYRFIGVNTLGWPLEESRIGDTVTFGENEELVVTFDDFRPLMDNEDLYYLVYSITNNTDITLSMPILFAASQNGEDRMPSDGGMVMSDELSEYEFFADIESGATSQMVMIFSDLDKDAPLNLLVSAFLSNMDEDMYEPLGDSYMLRVNLPVID